MKTNISDATLFLCDIILKYFSLENEIKRQRDVFTLSEIANRLQADIPPEMYCGDLHDLHDAILADTKLAILNVVQDIEYKIKKVKNNE